MSNTALGFPFGFFTNDNQPQDAKYYNRITKLPYTNVAEATNLAVMPLEIRYKGLTINIDGKEYWWETGTANNQLVEKLPNLTGYVPYTGANATVNLGTQDIKSGNAYLYDFDGGGYVSLNGAKDRFNFINSAGTQIGYFSSSDFRMINGTKYGNIQLDTLTANRIYTLPDKTGIIALISDITASTVTKTSQLINDGDDGISHFISNLDLPSLLTLYPTTVASDISGYVKLVTDTHDISYNTTAQDVPTGPITGQAQLLSSLATGPGIINGNPGVFNITVVGNILKTSGTGTAEFFFRVYKRTAAGAETLIATSNNTIPVTNGSYAEFSTIALWDDGIFLLTDRVVLKFYANRITSPIGSTPTYNFQFGGATPVRALVPIPLSTIPAGNFDGLSDVTITSPANNDIPAYETSTGLWKNKTIQTALGYTPKPQGRTTFNNTDKTLSSTDVYLAQIGTMSSARIVYLPLASSVNPGYEIIIGDESGSVSSSFPIIISKSAGSSDTIAGGNAINIMAPYGMRRLFSDGATKWTYDAGVLRNSNNLSDVSNTATALSNIGGLPIQAGQAATTALTFETDRVYGTIASPETGNITFNTTNAKLGVTNIIIHNNTLVAPTLTGMKKLSGSSSYVVNTINYIYITYINATEVIYSINQRTQ
jgi:hypothetical protein